MIALALSLAQASATLSLAQVRALSPAAAGEAVLRDWPHGPIETFEPAPGGQLFPNMIEEQLVERPTMNGAGCLRRRWTVKFRAAPSAAIDSALPDTTLDGTYSTSEIALAAKGVCPHGAYVHLSEGVSVGRGWDALTRLEEITAGRAHVRFGCSDSTSSGLCGDNRAIRAALRMLKPWAVDPDPGDVVVLMGVPGHHDVVTKARFNPVDRSLVAINREEAPPF